MDLPALQKLFPHLLAQLYEWCWNHGYEITGGEWWRSDETAQIDEKEGKGRAKSLHRLRIAEDLNLFKNGVYLKRLEDYQPPGQFWESLTTPEYKCVWGGRFNDADHFSLEYGGME